MISTPMTPTEELVSLPPRRASLESSASMAEACELARRLADMIERLRLCTPEGDQAQTLRIAEGMARSVADAVSDVMRSRPVHTA
ncbi:hypothetical protein BE08_24405 [Sorangium cellulosum]|uniref:Uncharacterized protein n=1 Tax=Sorangium cellulosum TaxID=56 RepID=A0A150P8Y4_SORCE|nr:hypothetical protein BE08_24405 [Sorangium cellulosum]